MIKRTLYFGNPAYISTRLQQLVIALPDTAEQKTAAIEDIGVIILDHPQITISQAAMAQLLANNTALITCNTTHHPVGLLLNLDGNQLQSQKFKAQIEATQPLKKQLWQQTVIAKINNQASVLQKLNRPEKPLINYAETVKSGDSGNIEAKAAAYYWKNIFTHTAGFTRDRFGMPPNNLLNYGYAILRALVARALVGSGLLPTLGIFHKNQYNAYCLADDIMEPYRPYVDLLVEKLSRDYNNPTDLSPGIKKEFLLLPASDVKIEGQKSPMIVAVQKTTASLAKCYEGTARKLIYPVI